MIICLVVILFVNVNAQLDTTTYYPLQVGNYWEYWAGTLQGPRGFYSKVIGDTIMPNKKSYYKIEEGYFENNTPYYRYERVESLKVYRFYNDPQSCPELEYVFFNFEVPDSVIWQICPIDFNWFKGVGFTFYQYYNLFNKSLESKVFQYVEVINQDTIWAPLGFPSFTITAKAIGKVNQLIHGSGYYELYGAIINGQIYGTITDVNEDNRSPETLNFVLNIYPNPFNNQTTVAFTLPFEQKVTIAVFNILGEKVISIADQIFSSGNHSIKLNLSGFTSGLYLLLFKSEYFEETKKLVLIK